MGYWQVADKWGVGTALNASSHVHFTLRQGIVTEVFSPDLDVACVRDFGLIVADGKDFFSEEQFDTDSVIEWLAEGVPAYRLTNTHRGGRYRITKEVITDPVRDCLLQRICFEALQGSRDDYRIHALLNPRLQNRADDNSAHLGEHRGRPMLFAQRNDSALAMACSTAWKKRSVGYVGVSDGWHAMELDAGGMRQRGPYGRGGFGVVRRPVRPRGGTGRGCRFRRIPRRAKSRRRI
jgi:glucoamylase